MAATTHTASFVSYYGKLWEIQYKVKDREVISVDWVSINGKKFPIRTANRETTILNVVEKKIDLVEYACDDAAERETFHFVDNE